MPDAKPPVSSAKFYCPVHGKTNHVLGLNQCVYCLECVMAVATEHLIPVGRNHEVFP